MNQIKFSHNWNNKLNNKIFTTIRKYNSEKEQYYMSLVTEFLEVILEGKYIGKAELLYVEKNIYKNIPYGFLYLDTGFTTCSQVDELFDKFGIKPNDEVLILTFKKE